MKCQSVAGIFFASSSYVTLALKRLNQAKRFNTNIILLSIDQRLGASKIDVKNQNYVRNAMIGDPRMGTYSICSIILTKTS